MKNEKKIESLTSQIEILDTLLLTTSQELVALESNIKQIEGYALGAKEATNKVEDYIKKQKEEVATLERAEKIQPAMTTLLVSATGNILKFVKDFSSEADKLHHIRLGEILGIKNRTTKLSVLIDSKKSEIEKLRVEDETTENVTAESMEVTWEEPSVSQPVEVPNITEDSPSVEESKIRPDKNPHSRTGQAAMDLMQRRKKSKEKFVVEETIKSKRGRKKKF
jgi:hypothetical protein